MARSVADHAYRAAAATLEDFLRNLKLDATAAYAEALATQRTLEQQRKAADYLSQLVLAQQRRSPGGDIGETDLTQSRVDELQFQNDLLNAQNDAQVAQLALSRFLGRRFGQTTLMVRGKLELEPRSFELAQLLANALQERPDLIALRHARDGAQSGIRLAKASRCARCEHRPDLHLYHRLGELCGPRRARQHGGVDSCPSPAALEPATRRNPNRPPDGRTGGENVGSRRAQGRGAGAATFGTYQLMTERVQKFHGELLKGADEVLAAKRFGYEHGQTTLLDLLDAQRTANNIHQSYNDALADAAKALIELERAAQLNDVSLELAAAWTEEPPGFRVTAVGQVSLEG